jgi:hypothetical protein
LLFTSGIWIRLLLAQAKATTLPLSPQFVICTARYKRKEKEKKRGMKHK